MNTKKNASIVTFRMLCSGERVIVMWKNWIYLYYSLGWIYPYQFIAYGFYPSEVFFRFFLCVIQLSKNYEIVSYQASYVSRLMIGLFSLEIQRVEPKDGKSHNLMLFFSLNFILSCSFRAILGIPLDRIHVLLTLKDYKTWAWSQTSNKNWTCGLLWRILWFFKKGFFGGF